MKLIKVFIPYIAVAGLLIGFFGINTVYGSIETDFRDSYITDYTKCTFSGTGWTDTVEIEGASDTVTAYQIRPDGFTLGSIVCGWDAFGGFNSFPAGTVLDQVFFTTVGFKTTAPLYDVDIQRVGGGCNTVGEVDSGLGTSLTNAHHTFAFADATTDCQEAFNGEIALNTLGDLEYVLSPHSSVTSGTKSIDIDSIRATVWFHFDNTLSSTRIVSFNLSNVTEGTYPILLTSGSDVSGTYYHKSTGDDYTRLEMKLHNFFTNEDFYIYSSITTDDVITSFGVTDFCDLLCDNGDTYQIAVRFADEDSSSVSGWFSTYYYFSYNARTDIDYGTTTNPFSTSTNPFGGNASSTLGQLGQIISASPTIQAVAHYCNLLHISTFDPVACVYYLIIPDSTDVSVFFNVFQSTVLSAMPFVGSFWTTSATSLPTLSATIPSGLPGAGSSISLPLTGKIMGTGSILSTATSTASSTATLYSLTRGYWDTFVYLCLGFYILSRLLSSHIFSKLKRH